MTSTVESACSAPRSVRAMSAPPPPAAGHLLAWQEGGGGGAVGHPVASTTCTCRNCPSQPVTSCRACLTSTRSQGSVLPAVCTPTSPQFARHPPVWVLGRLLQRRGSRTLKSGVQFSIAGAGECAPRNTQCSPALTGAGTGLGGGECSGDLVEEGAPGTRRHLHRRGECAGSPSAEARRCGAEQGTGRRAPETQSQRGHGPSGDCWGPRELRRRHEAAAPSGVCAHG